MSQTTQSSKSAKAAEASRATSVELRNAACGKHLLNLLVKEAMLLVPPPLLEVVSRVIFVVSLLNPVRRDRKAP